MHLADGIDTHADRILALTDDGRQWRYADALELGRTLAGPGLARRLVLCLCGNDAPSLVGYLAILRAGGVPMLVNPELATDALAALVAAYRPAFAWVPGAHAAWFPAARSAATFEAHHLLAAAAPADYPIHDDLALLLGTSGSTGSPMFVRQSARNIDSNAEAIATYLGITPDERPITTLPMSYTYGLSIIHSHVLRGCAIAVTARGFFDRGFWDFIRATEATSFGGVPYHYEMLKKLRFWRMSLPSLRTLTQAGGRMDPALSREVATECAARGIGFFTMYGQAEATARMAYLEPARAIEKAGTIGKPIPGGEFWLEDEGGQRIEAADTPGQLVYRGDNVTLGYAAGHGDLARGDDNGGILHTGDLACRDEDGDYRIVGREKRFLKLFGHRINLQDVDDLLQREGLDAACGGRDDHLRVYARQLSGESATSVKRAIAERLRVHPSAVEVVAVPELPRTEAGKIRFAALEHLAGKVIA